MFNLTLIFTLIKHVNMANVEIKYGRVDSLIAMPRIKQSESSNLLIETGMLKGRTDTD